MAENILLGDKKSKIIDTGSFRVQGNLLRWKDQVLQMSNISMISSANMEAPTFPVASVVMILVGLAFSTSFALLAILLILVGGAWIAYWYFIMNETKGKKYLHILTNSGYVYSILFRREQFLRDVLDVMSNVIEDGNRDDVNFQVDITNARFIKLEEGSQYNEFYRNSFNDSSRAVSNKGG